MAVAACEPYKVVEAGAQPIGDGMSITKTKPWVQILQPHAPDGPDQVWTLDGMALNTLLIYGGLADGKVLLEVKGDNKQPPAFSSSMEGLEIAELVGNTVSRGLAGGVSVKTVSLAPATFMGAPGFAAEFAFPTAGGLDMRAFAEGANIGGKLYMLLYVAPRIHYFAKDLDEVRAIAASAVSKGSGA
jgi:hypothetical protein